MEVTTDQEIYKNSGVLNNITRILGVILSLYLIYYAWTLHIPRQRFAIRFLGLGLSLFYVYKLSEYISEREKKETILRRLNYFACMAFVVIALTSSIYVDYHFYRLLQEAPIIGYNFFDIMIGSLIIITVIDATNRAYGKLITSVVIFSVLYAIFGFLFPGVFYHSGFDVSRVAIRGAIGLDGVYGFVLEVGTTWVAIFVIFAGMAKSYGFIDYITKISREFQGLVKSGVVHVAIVASMLMGSITGSSVANVATTGSFTIPMMKKQGIKSDFAGAIESVASSGGQMMPPVMGVAAFLMADILGIPYLDVIQAALIPAILFYTSVAISVQLLIYKHGWEVEVKRSFDFSIIYGGLHYILPVLVLLYTLTIAKFSPLSAGLYTVMTLVFTMVIKDIADEGISIKTIQKILYKTEKALTKGAVEMAPLIGVLASLGIIISMLTQTGFTQRLGTRIILLSGGVFVLILTFAMVASILFGLGMPTPAAYLVVVFLVAPALVESGVADITAHLFVFYFAMLSAITPPVALAVVVASRISESSFNKTATQAIRIGAPGFIVPFIFIQYPSLIIWSFPGTILALGIAGIGLFIFSTSITGYSGLSNLKLVERVILLAMALFILFGTFELKLVGTAAMGVLLSIKFLLHISYI